jgi:peptidoglycan/xylan/chitin deacetylase (PgdA/CDA1 family)
METRPPYRRALFITRVALAAGVLLSLVLIVKLLWDSEAAGKADKLAVEGRLSSLEQRVGDLQKILETAQTENSALKSQMEGNLLTLQDVYFEALKKNDGLIPVWTDPRPGRRAYLTFDDGPTENTVLVLDTLKAQKVKATFFVNGRPEWAPVYKRIVQEGHRLGNHTYSHDYNLIYASVTAYLQDTEKLDAFLASLGLVPPRIYRFPGGAKNEIAARLGGPDLTGRVTASMADRGYRFFEWNVAVGEGESRPESRLFASGDIRKNILAQVKNKRVAVILLHDGPGHRETALALPGIIDGLKRLGFTFDVLP